MVLFLGVCRALKAMHQYRVGKAPGGERSARDARKVREQAAKTDEEAQDEVEANSGRRRDRRQMTMDEVEQEPLMDGEVTRSQDGVPPGEVRAYAHRDIKPGKLSIRRTPSTHPLVQTL